MAKSAVMPEGHLHAVVDAIAAAGSQQLARRAAEGAPVPFDLVEVPSSGSGAPLFSYRPRTRDFVEEHIDALRQLMAWTTAVNVLAGFDGLGDYLLSHGERHVPIDARDRADLTLRVLLARMHEDTGDFIHTPQRSAASADELARCLLAGRIEGTVVVPLLGVRLDAERLKLEDGLELVRDDVIDGLPREARSPVRTRPGTVVVVSSLEDPARAAALAQARPRLRALLSALRLYGHPAPALAPVAWSRMRGDGWASHPFIGTSARATGTLHITAEEEPSIVGFCALMAQRSFDHGTPAWAMRRFELACERPDHGEALTDTLLGLRALLEADQLGSGVLSERVAALCAAPGEWHELRDRVQIAEALEVSMMQGTTTDPTRTRALSLELRGHLRALLRDMACGHLPVDLVDVAEHHLAHDELTAPVDVAPSSFVDDRGFHDAVDATFEDHPVVATDTRDATGTHPVATRQGERSGSHAAVRPQEDRSGTHAAVRPHDDTSGTHTAVQSYDVPAHPRPASEYLSPAPPADAAPLRPVVPAIPAERRPVQVHRQPSSGGPAAHDPRMMTAAGERFEDAFIRSLTEGPGSLR